MLQIIAGVQAPPRAGVLLLSAGLAWFLSGATASAALIIQLQPASTTVAAGSSGNELDVFLINDGNNPVGPFTLSGFNVTLTTALPSETGTRTG